MDQGEGISNPEGKTPKQVVIQGIQGKVYITNVTQGIQVILKSKPLNRVCDPRYTKTAQAIMKTKSLSRKGIINPKRKTPKRAHRPRVPRSNC